MKGWPEEGFAGTKEMAHLGLDNASATYVSIVVREPLDSLPVDNAFRRSVECKPSNTVAALNSNPSRHAATASRSGLLASITLFLDLLVGQIGGQIFIPLANVAIIF